MSFATKPKARPGSTLRHSKRKARREERHSVRHAILSCEDWDGFVMPAFPRYVRWIFW